MQKKKTCMCCDEALDVQGEHLSLDVMLYYVILILCKIAPSACNGRSYMQEVKQKDRKTLQTSIRYCRRTMTLYTEQEIWLGRARASSTLVGKLSIWLDYVRIPYNYVFCPICVWCNISTVYIHRCVHMGLCQYIDLCFHAPCLHTFWHAILHLFTFFLFLF